MSDIHLTNIYNNVIDYFDGIRAGNESALTEFFDYLVQSEDQALAMIQLVTKGKRPPESILKKGSIEAGFILYWIHFPPRKMLEIIDSNIILKTLYDGLKLEAPQTRVTTAEYDNMIGLLETKGVAWNDGTLFGTEKYEQLDPLWIIAVFNYALNLITPSDIVKFPNNPPYSGCLNRKSSHTGSDPVIGIVGDWGTGRYTDKNGPNSSISPSQRIMNDIQSNPNIDYLLHLGDVYYAGTDYRPVSFEEWLNFKILWPDQGAARNFTLNSNHEMYGDASGYFDVALKSDGPFGHQNGMSYFSLTYGKWLLIGLDSGYYSDAANGTKFYMDGGIGTDIFNQQIKWLERFKGHDGPIMIFSHHNPCDFTGDVFENTLWKQVTNAIGFPAVWYYGHVHNGVVYTQLKDGAAIPFIPTKARCCGHGAVPFGNAWETESNIDYYAHTPDPVMGEPRVLNGYATITLHSDGGYDEVFYETGNKTPVYNRHWSVNKLHVD